MRWNNLSDDAPGAAPALFGTSVVTRTFDTPEFRGVTFHEVRARSVINRVPGASRMPFTYTVNPYRAAPTPASTASRGTRTATWTWTPAPASTPRSW